MPSYASEADLEDDLVRRSAELLPNPPSWIARQLHTSAKGFIDLLGVDRDGRLVVYELKVNRTGRETLAQILDYASWLDSESIEEIERRVCESSGQHGIPQLTSFQEFDKTRLRPTRLVIVAGEANASLKRMVSFIQGYGLDVSVSTVRHTTAPLPDLDDLASSFGVASEWRESLDTLDYCFGGRGHRLRHLKNGLNYELRDYTGTFRSYAGVFVNDRKTGRENGNMFLAVHDAAIDISGAEYDRLRTSLEQIGMKWVRGNVREKYFPQNRQQLLRGLGEVANYLDTILAESHPRPE